MSIGLALSGGGAKGIAHIGVIKALIKNNIPIDYISGCSSGSIIAGLFSAGYSPDEMLNIVKNNANKIIDYDGRVGFKLLSTAFTKKLNIKGFVKGNSIERVLRTYLQQKKIYSITDIKMPLAIPVVNLATGEVVYFTNVNKSNEENACNIQEISKVESDIIVGTYGDKSYDDIPSCLNYGDLADIVRASCSFPGVFIPKNIEGIDYIDGGVRVNTPVRILKKIGADRIIAITFDCNNKFKLGINNIVEIFEQSFNLLSHNSNITERNEADVNIRLCVNNVSLLDFSKTNMLVTRGYNIVNRNIEMIKKSLKII